MMTVDFFEKHLVPLVQEASSKGVVMTQERFLEWVMKDRNRAAKYGAIRWDVNEFTPEEWDETVKDIISL